MVEFALVLPMLLVLLLGVADFGRVFAAGITIEAAARDAAEAAAQEYLHNPPAAMDLPAPAPGDPTYYQALHDLAAKTACREAKDLDSTGYVPDDPATPAIDEESCPAMPAIQVCVHDNEDPLCGQTAFGASVPSPGCEPMGTPMDTTMAGGTEQSRYVEVRLCYRFTTLFNLSNLQLPFGWSLSIGDIWLNKTRTFTVGWYPALPTPVPPPPPSPPPSAPAPTDTPSPSPTPSDTPSGSPSPTPTPAPACEVPHPNFSFAPNDKKSPMLVQFMDTSVPINCPITGWDWDFGDGTAHSNIANPTHNYVNNTGQTVTFTVRLTVSSAAGSASRTATVTVKKA